MIKRGAIWKDIKFYHQYFAVPPRIAAAGGNRGQKIGATTSGLLTSAGSGSWMKVRPATRSGVPTMNECRFRPARRSKTPFGALFSVTGTVRDIDRNVTKENTS
ncbi:hypothetical protein [Ruegeria marina]|uniref:Uncharacterized protein n=1 Tax=Ruegeria marina TaxID=639004 RepID=A0A1G6UY21_9RHOB|nr:hypothetical protein [Ruegeria marina]SDD46161.1 hypothetical protein SAMN04488239_107186 [Ruegeria marina]